MPAASYDVILFDADDTLFDFAAAEKAAFAACLEGFVGEVVHVDALAVYREVSLALWRDLERRRLSLAQVSELRWAALAQRCGFRYRVPEVAAAFLEVLSTQAQLIDGAIQVCAALAEAHTIGIVTNGFETVQRARLAASPLWAHVDFMVTSEAVGAAKPAARPFERALSLCEGRVRPERVLMVGDSHSSDVAGAKGMGFHACWFNPGRRTGRHDVKPDHEIRALPELLAVAGIQPPE